MKKRVVVIGGGFAGSNTAKRLEDNFDVILIDTKNYFEFTPGILRTIVEPRHIKRIQILHSHYLKKAKIIIGTVLNVDKNFVFVNGEKIDYDYLVICSGSKYELPIKEQGVVIAARAEHLRNCSNTLFDSENILIIGGGLVGIELAAEIVTHFPNKKITIAHSRERLINRNHRKTSSSASKFLKERGVKFLFNTFINDLNKVKKDYDMVFLCTGIKPNFEFMKLNFSSNISNSNQIKVNEFLQLKGFRNIFVGGDVGNVLEEKTAQNAEEQAKTISENIISLEEGGELKKYGLRKRTIVISLGKYKGIIERNNFVWYGLIPGIIKSLIERIVMFKH